MTARAFLPACAALALACAASGDTQPPLEGPDGTPLAGDPARGATLFDDRERGHCVLCHSLTASPARFQGNIGSPLDDAGARFRPAELRYRIADMTRLNPDSRMPAYYRKTGFNQVAREYRGQSVLTAQELEDVVAFLATQRGDQ